MACTLFKLPSLNSNICNFLVIPVRNGHHLRGKDPLVAKSLKQKLEEMNAKDPSIYFRVDIGLPPPQINRSQRFHERLKFIKQQRKNPEIEKLSRSQRLLINLDETQEEFNKTNGPYFIKRIADHFGVFEHLYGDAYFYPFVTLNVAFNKEDVAIPVYFGNVIKPSEATEKPEIKYESDDKTYWTLVLTNPDSHFTEQDKEYVHWFVANIPGNKIEQGETLVEYLQPFPPKGTGYHRHIFVLYKQNKKLDLSAYKREGKCLNLDERTFNTYDFYKRLQDDITPAGLAFFQSDWESSLKQFYHNTLDMKEPIFEYDFPKPYIRKQEWFPLRKPFNLYLDRYRDEKQINKEFLLRKLKNAHPFKAPPPPLPFPNAQYWEGYLPSWLKIEEEKYRMKWGRVNNIE